MRGTRIFAARVELMTGTIRHNVTALLKSAGIIFTLNDAFVNTGLCRSQNKNSLCSYALFRKSSRLKKLRNVSPSI